MTHAVRPIDSSMENVGSVGALSILVVEISTLKDPILNYKQKHCLLQYYFNNRDFYC